MRTTVRVSELALFMRCRRRTYLQYELNYDSTPRVAGMGTAFHTLIAGYYGGEQPSDSNPLPPLSVEDNATVWAMYDTYVEEVESNGMDVGVETIALEERIEAEIIPGISLSGGIDHIYEDTVTGGVVIQDHKTVASFFDTAQRDFQLMTYAWLAVQAGYEVTAIEHNIIKRNKRTSRSKPPYIQRNRVYVSPDEIKNWGRVLEHLMMEYRMSMQAAEDTGMGVKYPGLWAKGTNDCSWYCPFSSICGMIDDPEADVAGVLEAEYHKREEAPQ